MSNFPFSVGYDYLLNQISNHQASNAGGFPPFNIVKLEENQYKIEVALAGISKDEIEVVQEDNVLKVRSLYETNSPTSTYYHRGISNKKFTREFIIERDIKVKSVSHKDGLLTIVLTKEIPEEKKPKRFSID